MRVEAGNEGVVAGGGEEVGVGKSEGRGAGGGEYGETVRVRDIGVFERDSFIYIRVQ
jgi:hypothetical protein